MKGQSPFETYMFHTEVQQRQEQQLFSTFYRNFKCNSSPWCTSIFPSFSTLIFCHFSSDHFQMHLYTSVEKWARLKIVSDCFDFIYTTKDILICYQHFVESIVNKRRKKPTSSNYYMFALVNYCLFSSSPNSIQTKQIACSSSFVSVFFSPNIHRYCIYIVQMNSYF